MIERLTSLRKSKKGFTLVELIVVIVIIAILAAALVTSLIGYVNKAKGTSCLVEANNAYIAAQSYLSDYFGTGAGKDATPSAGDLGASSSPTMSDVITNVNTYLGSGTSVTSSNLTDVTIDTNGTITAFSYTSHGKTASYSSGTWSVS